jgi:LytS/YehU family sensor histidine kinase
MYEDVVRADRLLCDLATLLRQTLAAQQATSHTLADELALITPYLTLMQARFGERLQVAIEASDSARLCQVPTLLLISPVENAIKHDVAHSGEPVHVTIHAWCDERGLQLEVDNSGTAPLRTERKGGIGLDNLRQRLHAMYGARAGVTLKAREGGGSRLHIVLPATAGVAA